MTWPAPHPNDVRMITPPWHPLCALVMGALFLHHPAWMAGGRPR